MANRYKNNYRRAKMRKRLEAEERNCAICGKPIDYSLTTYRDPKDGKIKRHPESFEMDHIDAVKNGGAPLDYSNVQATHRKCNRKKSDKRMQQIRVKPAHPRTSQDW